MERVVEPARGPLRGELRVPGDKSISHRAVLFAAISEGTSRISGLLDSADIRSTVAAISALDATVIERDGGLEVTGWGEAGPTAPSTPVDCGNSGTTVRLLSGIVAGWPIEVTFEGDESLSRRPMDRVAEPLTRMGAGVTLTDGHLPMTVLGGELQAITHDSPVASAQVKSLVLLAGLRAHGRTTVREPAPSRDHTERMLPEFGVEVISASDGLGAAVEGPIVPHSTDVRVPGDPSSAAFFAAAAAMVPGSRVALGGVLLNATRTASFEVLRRMGTPIGVAHEGRAAGEEVGTVSVSAAPRLIATSIRASEVPALIDEIPVLAVVATQAQGVTRFEGVGELRVKESDRLQAVVDALGLLGANVRAGDDWLEVEGVTELRGDVTLDSLGDHRLAMAFHVAGLVTSGPLRIERYKAVAVSYPAFADDMQRLLASGGDAS